MGYMDITITVRAKDIGPALQCAMLVRAALEGFDTDINVLPFNPDEGKRGEVISVHEPRKHRATMPHRATAATTLMFFALSLSVQMEQLTTSDLQEKIKGSNDNNGTSWNPESASSTMGSLKEKGYVSVINTLAAAKSGAARNVYRITDKGREHYTAMTAVVPIGGNGHANGAASNEGGSGEGEGERL